MAEQLIQEVRQSKSLSQSELNQLVKTDFFKLLLDEPEALLATLVYRRFDIAALIVKVQPVLDQMQITGRIPSGILTSSDAAWLIYHVVWFASSIIFPNRTNIQQLPGPGILFALEDLADLIWDWLGEVIPIPLPTKKQLYKFFKNNPRLLPVLLIGLSNKIPQILDELKRTQKKTSFLNITKIMLGVWPIIIALCSLAHLFIRPQDSGPREYRAGYLRPSDGSSGGNF